MHQAALEVLACPYCITGLTLDADPAEGSVREGALGCPKCARSFPIREGIPHFIETAQLSGANRRFARFYDRFSATYSPVVRLGFVFFGGERRARQEILDRVEPADGRILEVSIGPGPNLPYLCERPGVREVHGLDIAINQLHRCQGLAEKLGCSVDLSLGAAESLPYASGAFDSVLHVGGINFFSDRRQAAAEMIRVARPGAKIVIADETERLARFYERLTGLSQSDGGRGPVRVSPLDWIPPAMEHIEVHDIWRAHGEPHGYCLCFRKPLQRS